MRGNEMSSRIVISRLLSSPLRLDTICTTIVIMTEWVSDNSCYHTLFLYSWSGEISFGALLC